MQLFDESCKHFADVFPVRDVEGEILHPGPEHDGRSGGHDHRLGLRPQKWGAFKDPLDYKSSNRVKTF